MRIGKNYTTIFASAIYKSWRANIGIQTDRWCSIKLYREHISRIVWDNTVSANCTCTITAARWFWMFLSQRFERLSKSTRCLSQRTALSEMTKLGCFQFSTCAECEREHSRGIGVFLFTDKFTAQGVSIHKDNH